MFPQLQARRRSSYRHYRRSRWSYDDEDEWYTDSMCLGFIAAVTLLFAGTAIIIYSVNSYPTRPSSFTPPARPPPNQKYLPKIKKIAHWSDKMEAVHNQMSHRPLAGRNLTFPVKLRWPVVWAAPFWSWSGYGNEALAYVLGLLEHGLVRKEDLYIVQSGDGIHSEITDNVDPAVRRLLDELAWDNVKKNLNESLWRRPAIVICHTFPKCWRKPAGNQVFPGFGCPCPSDEFMSNHVYKLGRGMFETETLPYTFVPHANSMDEVWVPSDFNVESFARAGVNRAKLFTLGQGVNTSLFDPDAFGEGQKMVLPELGALLVTGPGSRPKSPPPSPPAAPINASTDAPAAAPPASESAPKSGTESESGSEDGTAKRPGLLRLLRRLLSHDTAAAAATTASPAQPVETAVTGRPTHPSFSSSNSSSGTGSDASISARPLPWSSPSHPSLQPPVRPPGLRSRRQREQQGNPSSGSSSNGSSSNGSSKGRPFVFLSIFKWEARKGWDLLLPAFLREFSKPGDNVELHIVTHPFDQQVDDWAAHIRSALRRLMPELRSDQNFEALPRVWVYTDYIADKDYPLLYRGGDALVIPTRGEGWGRPQMEAMAMRLPVISTFWSGITAYLNEDVGYPLRIDGIVPADEGGGSFGFFNGQRWAQPSVDHLRQLMRHVVEHPSEASAKGAAAREWLLQEFSPRAISEKLLAQILRVQDKLEYQMGARRFPPMPPMPPSPPRRSREDELRDRRSRKNPSSHKDKQSKLRGGHKSTWWS